MLSQYTRTKNKCLIATTFYAYNKRHRTLKIITFNKLTNNYNKLITNYIKDYKFVA